MHDTIDHHRLTDDFTPPGQPVAAPFDGIARTGHVATDNLAMPATEFPP
jgi:hypothetical protein